MSRLGWVPREEQLALDGGSLQPGRSRAVLVSTRQTVQSTLPTCEARTTGAVVHEKASRIPTISASNTVFPALLLAPGASCPQLAPLPASPIDPGSVRLVRIDADWLASNTRVLYVSYRRETSPSAVADSVYNLTDYNGAVSGPVLHSSRWIYGAPSQGTV